MFRPVRSCSPPTLPVLSLSHWVNHLSANRVNSSRESFPSLSASPEKNVGARSIEGPKEIRWVAGGGPALGQRRCGGGGGHVPPPFGSIAAHCSGVNVRRTIE